MATWSITPNDGGANINSSGVVTFQQNTSTSAKEYTIRYTNGSCSCTKKMTVAASSSPLPPVDPTCTCASSNFRLGSISGAGSSSSNRISADGGTITISYTADCGTVIYEENESDLSSSNVTVNSSTKKITINVPNYTGSTDRNIGLQFCLQEDGNCTAGTTVYQAKCTTGCGGGGCSCDSLNLKSKGTWSTSSVDLPSSIAGGGNVRDYTVDCTDGVSVSASETWIDASLNTSNKTISISAKTSNESSSDRTGSVTVKVGSTTCKTISVKQSKGGGGGGLSCNLSNFVCYCEDKKVKVRFESDPWCTGKTVTLSFLNNGTTITSVTETITSTSTTVSVSDNRFSESSDGKYHITISYKVGTSTSKYESFEITPCPKDDEYCVTVVNINGKTSAANFINYNTLKLTMSNGDVLTFDVEGSVQGTGSGQAGSMNTFEITFNKTKYEGMDINYVSLNTMPTQRTEIPSTSIKRLECNNPFTIDLTTT